MRKRFGAVLCLLGAAAILLSLVLPVFSLPQYNIIGGAGWPTLWFLFRTKYLYLAVCGVLACVAGLVLILIDKVKKDR